MRRGRSFSRSLEPTKSILGNYRKGPGTTYVTTLFAANEYGDEQVA
jgi:hypothetical protein